MSETIETGTRSAARGGFTAVCCMPNTQPVNDSASVTRGIVERAAASRHRARLAHRRRFGRQQRRSPRRNRRHERCGHRRRQRRRQARRHRAPDAPGDGLLQLARSAGDRPLRRSFAFRRRRHARRPALRAPRPEGNSRAIRIHLRWARRRDRRAHRRPPAHRAHVHHAARSNMSAPQKARACASPAKSRRTISLSPTKTSATIRITK